MNERQRIVQKNKHSEAETEKENDSKKKRKVKNNRKTIRNQQMPSIKNKIKNKIQRKKIINILLTAFLEAIWIDNTQSYKSVF